MSTNCLITKLKGVVNNDNLPKMNACILHVKVDSGDNPQFTRLWSRVNQTIKTNGNYLSLNIDGSSPTNELTITANADFKFYLLPGEYNIEVENKYQIYYAGFDTLTHFNISDFDYCIGIETLAFYDNRNVIGVITSLGTCYNMTVLNIYGTQITGSLNELLDLMAANGKADGTTLNFIAGNGIVTYNGSIANAKIFVFNNGSWSESE